MTAPPPGFEWLQDDAGTVLVRSDVREWIVPLVRAAAAHWAGYTTRDLAGGRGGTLWVQGHGHEAVVRRYRRGGLPARVWHHTYFGLRPRPFRELCVTETLRRRGAPIVEVYGAFVRWIAPACYQGWLATRYMPHACTLWKWTGGAAAAEERALVLQRVGEATRRLHDSGGRHPDLNLNNILLCTPCDPSGPPRVLFIDFDRARAAGSCARSPLADLVRLRRSARKLDPAGRRVTAADLDCLEAAYRRGAT